MVDLHVNSIHLKNVEAKVMYLDRDRNTAVQLFLDVTLTEHANP